MYRVVLVDDEPWALKGVRKAFNWNEFGFEVIAQTTSSAEALEIITKELPDAVFTDFRMPKMSGIELMQNAKKNGVNTEFIIISGFSDFSYIQEVLRQGAFDYCLKPLERDYAQELLMKLKQHLQTKKNGFALELFEIISEGNENLGELLKKYDLNFTKKNFQTIVVIAKEAHTSDILINFPSEITKIHISLGLNKSLYILNTNSSAENASIFYNIGEYSIGVSTISNSLKDLPLLYNEADIAARSSFIYGQKGVFQYKKRDITVLNNNLKNLYQYIGDKNIEKIKELTDNLPSFFITRNLFPEDVVYYWNCVTAKLFQNFAEESYNNGFDFMDYRQLMSQFSSIEALSEFIYNGSVLLIEGASEDKAVSESMNRDFYRLLSYIKEHYNEQLYLRDIAKVFFLSPNYCCSLFKKYTTNTFSDFINKIRIAKSKEFLKNSQLSIEEVTQKVGYNDYYYFNKLFKKYVGITPARYRNQID
jgi:two-component system, response regulator YesN